MEHIFEIVILGLIGYLIAEYVHVPDSIHKFGKYVLILLLAIAGVLFAGYFGYGVYLLITEPKNVVENLIFGTVIILVLLISFGSFYLSHKAWKNR